MAGIDKRLSSVELSEQLDMDQKQYSRYVCDSRAIPNIIDGLKPVQRRILWTMWNSSARDHFTKTVKVAGMVMGYHPHGNTSIEDAIAQMTQNFPFANNYPLILGEGVFGDVLDPKAIASPRYTEVKLSDFAKDLGLFEALEDIDYVSNYDESAKEPIYFVPKVPLVLLNPILGIATGFKCYMPQRKLEDVITVLLNVLHGKARASKKNIDPWVRDYYGAHHTVVNEHHMRVFVTGFGFERTKDGKIYLIAAPHNFNREKTILYLEELIKEHGDILRDYEDYSSDRFKIELLFKRGKRITDNVLTSLFTKETRDIIDQNVITSSGHLKNRTDGEIIEEFLAVRKMHLKRRFARLQRLAEEKCAKENELIRFITEKWNEKVILTSSRQALKTALEKAKFVYMDWLVSLPIYRLTKQEVNRSKEAIIEAKKQVLYYKRLKENKRSLDQFIETEINALLKKWKYIPAKYQDQH
ncbi:hypothetical protein COTS27_01442 [Spirochaetota bacterium]|nr:hypothetical protein COTS27_01442 [Spirochaetota bacterium]